MNLLIADDEMMIRKGLLSLDWNTIGIDEVFSASNGNEVRALLESVPLDLAIFDIKMPGMSGLELAELIQARSLDTAVILLTGFSDFEYARQALRCNVYEYILKPFRPRELLETVSKAKKRLEESRYQQQMIRQYETYSGNTGIGYRMQHYFPKASALALDILQELAERFAEPLTLEGIAEQYHFSTAYLSRKIKQETGFSFLDLLKAIRLSAAARFLQREEKINQAASKAGFRDQRYFSQAFRSAFGCSPSEFRKMENASQKTDFYSILTQLARKKDE